MTDLIKSVLWASGEPTLGDEGAQVLHARRAQGCDLHHDLLYYE